MYLCLPKTGRRRWIKHAATPITDSVMARFIGMSFYLVSPCRFSALSSPKGIFCVWPALGSAVNLLPTPTLVSPGCYNLLWHGTLSRLPSMLWTASSCSPSHVPPGEHVEKWVAARNRLWDMQDWLIGQLPQMIIWKRSVEEKDNTAVICKETVLAFSTCQPTFPLRSFSASAVKELLILFQNPGDGSLSRSGGRKQVRGTCTAQESWGWWGNTARAWGEGGWVGNCNSLS